MLVIPPATAKDVFLVRKLIQEFTEFEHDQNYRETPARRFAPGYFRTLILHKRWSIGAIFG